MIPKPGGLENYFAELAEKAMNDPANVAALSEIGVRYGITLGGGQVGSLCAYVFTGALANEAPSESMGSVN